MYNTGFLFKITTNNIENVMYHVSNVYIVILIKDFNWTLS